MNDIDELLKRGVDQILPSKDELEKELRSGKKLRIYQGFDPTSPELHIGHMLGLKKLRQWQDLGHEVIFLIGDFTGMTGDPTGKDKTREPLSQEQVLENAKTYREQAGRILRFDGENPVLIKYNSEWLTKLSALESAKLMSHISIQQILERDMFQKRLKNNQEISMVETIYPIMQGYDSVAMDVDVEVGGRDQLFNMMVGRTLMRKLKGKNKFVMTTPLLEDSEGKKIGKTEGNAIALADKPEDLFGKIMGLSDDVLIKAFEYLTSVPMDEVEKVGAELKNGASPLEVKKRLAFEIVKDLNNEDNAKKAREHFEKTVQHHELPEEMATVTLNPETHLEISELLVELGLSGSRSEAKRMVEQGGVYVNEELIDKPNEEIIPEDNMIIKAGKRNFVRIKVS
jgi:tyrosyl-tRNA synthetase